MRNKLLEAIKPLQLNTNDKNKLVNTIIDIGNSGDRGGESNTGYITYYALNEELGNNETFIQLLIEFQILCQYQDDNHIHMPRYDILKDVHFDRHGHIQRIMFVTKSMGYSDDLEISLAVDLKKILMLQQIFTEEQLKGMIEIDEKEFFRPLIEYDKKIEF